MNAMMTPRETRGLQIAQAKQSQVSRVEENFYTVKQHIRKITFNGKCHNNNKMERVNGEIRDREKTMRGLKKKRTTVLTGYQLYHNYIRPHEGLNGKTPAEACGIQIEGQNKWRTLIENAIRAKIKS